MAVVTMLFGMIPLKLFSAVRDNPNMTSRNRWKNFISFASCFSGGVFIAACLLDLFPDVQEQIAKVLKEIQDVYNVDLDYPVSEFIMVLGFFIILFIEQSVLHFQVWGLINSRGKLLPRSRFRVARGLSRSSFRSPEASREVV